MLVSFCVQACGLKCAIVLDIVVHIDSLLFPGWRPEVHNCDRYCCPYYFLIVFKFEPEMRNGRRHCSLKFVFLLFSSLDLKRATVDNGCVLCPGLDPGLDPDLVRIMVPGLGSGSQVWDPGLGPGFGPGLGRQSWPQVSAQGPGHSSKTLQITGLCRRDARFA